MTTPVEVRYQDDVVRLATARNLLFAVWLNSPSMRHLSILEKITLQHCDELKDRRQILISVLAAGTPNFSDEVRTESARLAKNNAPRRIATAHIVLLEGLRGVAARAFMSTTVLLGKPAVPTKVFQRADDAARWLLPHLKQTDWTYDQFMACCTAAQKVA